MSQQIDIWGRAGNKFIKATFHENVTPAQLTDAESQWKPFRDDAVERLITGGRTKKEVYGLIQHSHWNWVNKAQALRAGLLSIKCVGIEVEGEWQGLAMVDLDSHYSEMNPDKGKPLVYVEFLESAPWNLREMCDYPRFKLIGTRLMEAIVKLSINEGFHGRVGLFALPRAEYFYEKLWMVHVEGAIRYGMKLYEMTRENVLTFLGEQK